MTTYVAFLRGINVGGNAILPMKGLAALCTEIGFKEVRTYIQSGNVIFKSALSEQNLRLKLEKCLLKKMGKNINVVMRNAHELQSILSNNPFPKAEKSQVGVLLFTEPVSQELIDRMTVTGPELVRLGIRELYIHYPEGMGRSKLKLPSNGNLGTVRNINTIEKVGELMKQ